MAWHRLVDKPLNDAIVYQHIYASLGLNKIGNKCILLGLEKEHILPVNTAIYIVKWDKYI